MFTNKDKKLRPLRRNISDLEKNYEKLVSTLFRTHILHETERIVIEGIDFLIGKLELIMQSTQHLERDIITAKEDASDVYRKVNSMEACLEGRIVEVDRQECLRRILHLLQADDSTDLAWAKKRIYECYHERLSHEEVRDLEQERHLELDI